MIRRISAGATLMALLVCLSACNCMHGGGPSTSSKTVAAPRHEAEHARAPEPSGHAAARHVDDSDSYRDESDRDMGRLEDRRHR